MTCVERAVPTYTPDKIKHHTLHHLTGERYRPLLESGKLRIPDPVLIRGNSLYLVGFPAPSRFLTYTQRTETYRANWPSCGTGRPDDYPKRSDRSLLNLPEAERILELDCQGDRIYVLINMNPYHLSNHLYIPVPSDNGIEHMQGVASLGLEGIGTLQKISRDLNQVIYLVDTWPSIKHAHVHGMDDTILCSVEGGKNPQPFPLVNAVDHGQFRPHEVILHHGSDGDGIGEIAFPCVHTNDPDYLVRVASIFVELGIPHDMMMIRGQMMLFPMTPGVDPSIQVMDQWHWIPSTEFLGYCVPHPEASFSEGNVDYAGQTMTIDTFIADYYHSIAARMLPKKYLDQLLPA